MHGIWSTLIAVSCACGFAAGAWAETIDQTVDAAKDGTVKVSNVAGSVRIEVHEAAKVQVTGKTGDQVERVDVKASDGDVEIEGDVTGIVSIGPTESRFLINGRPVTARPGVTAIREGNSARNVNDVTVGRHVHVKGVWMDPQGGQQAVLAHEIKLQGPATAPPPRTACIINGGQVGAGIELEGNVSSGGASGFMMQVQGNRASGLVRIDTGGASFECSPASGPNAPTPAQCMASVTGGAKVHVRGTLQACDTQNAVVAARSVKVQK